MATSSMMLWVVSWLLTCGDDDTFNNLLMTYVPSYPFFLRLAATVLRISLNA